MPPPPPPPKKKSSVLRGTHPKPYTLYSKTLNPKPPFRGEVGARSAMLQRCALRLGVAASGMTAYRPGNPKPQTPNPKPQTPNPKRVPTQANVKPATASLASELAAKPRKKGLGFRVQGPPPARRTPWRSDMLGRRGNGRCREYGAWSRALSS